MSFGLDTILLLLVLTHFWALGSSRLVSCIRAVAWQGVLLAVLVIAAHINELTIEIVLPAVGSFVLKGLVFPWLLQRALRTANVRREVEPFVGYSASLLIGVGLLAISIWLGSRLPLPRPAISPLMVSISFFSILSGFFLIVSRKQALTQALGYLVLENGVYVFGVSLAQESPLLFELGVLLDVFVAVFVMGIMIFHISRAFDHLDTERLKALHD